MLKALRLIKQVVPFSMCVNTIWSQSTMGELLVQKHIDYVVNLNLPSDYEYWLTEHLRLNGLYWGLMALFILGKPEALKKEDVIEFVHKCYDSRSGGFAAFPGHDGHMLLTLSAIQILVLLDSPCPNKENVVQFIKSNQLPDGLFQGDRFGEIDTRFVYNAISALLLLEELTPEIAKPAVAYILRCRNFDGGFGLCPGAESHAAQTFTCLGTLAIADSLDLLLEQEKNLLGWWLSERQQDTFQNTKEFEGGLNGRPEKLPDVCYSWWVVSCLAILSKTHWIDMDKLSKFILLAQDPERGGISDRPDNQTDVFHTVFGLAGLSLGNYPGLDPVDPVYCMPKRITKNFKKWKK